MTDAADDQQRQADQPQQPKPTPMLVESIGGWRGLIDSGLPVVVFVVANALGGLRAAIWAAIGAGVVLVAIRLARRQTVQQAISGFFGILIAAFIANRTGEAKGFFLFGIWASFLYAGVFLVSLLARWPLVGLIWEYVDGRGIGTAWRKDRPLMRVYMLCTLLWVLVFLARGLVQRYLYDQDATGWLAFARLAMGYPFTIGALAVSVFAVRRVRKTEQQDTTPRPDDIVAEDIVAEDRVAEDRVAEDRVAEDRVAEDRVAEDRVAEDRVAERLRLRPEG